MKVLAYKISLLWAQLYQQLWPRQAVIIEVCGHCNQSCSYCYRLPDSTGPAAMMTAGNFRLVLKRLKAGFGRLALTLSGGEPLLNLDLAEIVRSAIEIDSNLTVISNLSLLTDSLATELRSAGLKNLQTTFVAPIPAVHDRLCGQGSFDRWLKGLESARRAGFNLSAILLVTGLTADLTTQSLNFLLALGIKNFMVNRFNAGYPAALPVSPAPADLFLTRAQLDDWLQNLENFAVRLGITIPLGIMVPSCLADFSRYRHLSFPSCPLGGTGRSPTYFAVGSDCRLRPCNHLPLKLGNLLDTEVKTILNSAALQQLNGQIMTPPRQCQTCRSFKICKGGCRGAAATWTGDILRLDPWIENLLSDDLR